MSLEKTLNEHGVYTYPLDVPISAESRESIEYALDAIDRALDVDGCDCDDDCTVESPKCRYRELAAARHRLQKALDPIHRSLHPDRQGSLSERIYLKRWIREQERMSHLNNGYGLLELILSPTRIPSRYGGGRYYVPPVSQRDAEVAATVIQWLGTNCGLGFIDAAEREIKEAKDLCRQIDYSHLCWANKNALSSDEALAREAAKYGLRADHKNYDRLVSVIIAAIEAGRNPAPGGAT